MILVSLGCSSGQDLAVDPEKSTKRLKRIDFRKFDKKNPKEWFEHLEIIFKSEQMVSDSHRFASLLKLIDDSVSPLLSSITRAKPDDAYVQAREVLIAEFSLSKFDRIKAYLQDSSPEADERLSQFASRIEVHFEDITLDDVRKFTVLRHAPPAVRLQLAGEFDSTGFKELVRKADTLSQRAREDALVVGAIQHRGRGKPSSSSNNGFVNQSRPGK
ncbi:Hypothetical predicted protein, partial [Paramuricea clavata]